MLSSELVEIVENVWQTAVGDAIRHLPTAEASAPQGVQALTASIYFKGAWPGVLTATCSAALARRIAAGMFGTPAEESSADDVRDAIGEIVNILGGNVKAILPPPCALSLPRVVEGDAEGSTLLGPHAITVDTVCFEFEGEPLVLRLMRDASP